MMKNKISFFGMIILILSLSFVFVGCDGDGGGAKNELSGTVTVGASGTISFEYRISYSGDKPGDTIRTCTFTTDLAAPNNSFTLNNGDSKFIDVSAGTKVNWTAKIASGGSLETRNYPEFDVCLRGSGK